jgi:hypothetical protein
LNEGVLGNGHIRLTRNIAEHAEKELAQILPAPLLPVLRGLPEIQLKNLICIPIKTWYYGLCAALTRLFFENAQGKRAGEGGRMNDEGKGRPSLRRSRLRPFLSAIALATAEALAKAEKRS